MIPTLSIHHPDDPTVMMTINTADLTADHVLWGVTTEVVAVDELGLTVGKGPRGKFYVKRGKEALTGPFETEGEALTSMAALS